MLVLGENIGTTITANIAAMGANVQARRAALAHFTYNMIGVVWSLLLMKPFLTRDQFRLYQLIWKRFVASRMAPALYETSSVWIRGGDYRFHASASKVRFEGFLSVYSQDDEKGEENDAGNRSQQDTAAP